MPSTHKDLIAWQRSMDLAVLVHEATRRFPREETYGITSQMRRSAVSIPSNIAEGHGRGSGAELARFLGIARGSLRELESQMELSRRFGYFTAEEFRCLEQSSEEVGRVLTGLIAAQSRRKEQTS